MFDASFAFTVDCSWSLGGGRNLVFNLNSISDEWRMRNLYRNG